MLPDWMYALLRLHRSHQAALGPLIQGVFLPSPLVPPLKMCAHLQDHLAHLRPATNMWFEDPDQTFSRKFLCKMLHIKGLRPFSDGKVRCLDARRKCCARF